MASETLIPGTAAEATARVGPAEVEESYPPFALDELAESAEGWERSRAVFASFVSLTAGWPTASTALLADSGLGHPDRR
jgi:hypothetical protein